MTQRQIKTQIMYAGQTSAYGTAATVTEELPRVQSFTPERRWNKVYDRGLGEGSKAVSALYQRYECGGTVNYRLTPTGFDFLKYWFGPKSGAGTAGDPYLLTEDDVINVASTDIQPFTFSAANNTTSQATDNTFIGCVGDSVTISGELGGFINISGKFLAQKDTSDTSLPSYTPVTEAALTMINSSVLWGATPTALTRVDSFSITYSNGLSRDLHYDVSSPFMQQPTVGNQGYTFTLRKKMLQSDATAIIDEFYGATGTPEDGSTSVVSPADNEFEISLSNGSQRATIWLDQCHIDSITDNKQLDGGLVLLEVQGTALYGKGNTPIKWWSV